MSSMPTRAQLKKNIKALRGRLERKPMDLDARMRMARTHRLLGERKKAVSHYRAVARYLSLSAQPLQAIAVLKELLQVDPHHEETLLFLAKLYARTRVADATRRGRVAVPILDAHGGGPLALPEGLPQSATGIWQAIRPQSTDVYTVLHEAEELGADEDISIAAELRELEESYELDEADVLEEVELDRRAAARQADDDGPTRVAAAPSQELSDLESYEILGPVTDEELILPRVPLFSTLSPEAFVDLGHAMVFQRARAGDVVFREGDPGDSCVVISRGRAVAYRAGEDGRDVELMRLGEGDFAGVFALMAAQSRQASLRAATDLEYFEIDKLAIAELIERHPAVGDALGGFFRERLLLNLLAVLPVFSNLSPGQRQELVARFADRVYEPEDELFYESFEHNGLWVVLAGEVRVSSEDDGEVARLVAGDYVGSFAGIDQDEADLGAIAVERAEVALLSHKLFGQLLADHPDLAAVREAFESHGLMLSEHVFAGNGRLPGDLAMLGRRPASPR